MVRSWGWSPHTHLLSSALRFWPNDISGKTGTELQSWLSPPQLVPRQQQVRDERLGAGRWEGCPRISEPQIP